MTTAIVIQARTGSTRLPGKVLAQLGDRTVIEQVIRRCQKIIGADVVICATSVLSGDDALVKPAEKAGALVVRGDESDVLSRYVLAASAVKASIVMRITADCALIDPEICSNLLALRASQNADYASNALELSFPVGLDCEAFTLKALMEAQEKASKPYEREHVTPWLIEAKSLKRANLHSGDASLGKLRWVLDYPEDLKFVRAVYDAHSPAGPDSMEETLQILKMNPALADLNASRVQSR